MAHLLELARVRMKGRDGWGRVARAEMDASLLPSMQEDRSRKVIPSLLEDSQPRMLARNCAIPVLTTFEIPCAVNGALRKLGKNTRAIP